MIRNRINKVCLNCNKDFDVIKSRKNAKYCCRKCKDLFQVGRFSGDKNPRWNGGVIMAKCQLCNKPFSIIRPSRIKIGRGKFCSKDCYWKSLEGKLPKNTNGLKLGRCFFKGKKKPEYSGKNSPCWKGDNVALSGLHKWVVRNLGKPTKCDFCNEDHLTQHQINWANKSGKYKRELSDWLRLCVKCHRRYDSKKGNDVNTSFI